MQVFVLEESRQSFAVNDQFFDVGVVTELCFVEMSNRGEPVHFPHFFRPPRLRLHISESRRETAGLLSVFQLSQIKIWNMNGGMMRFTLGFT